MLDIFIVQCRIHDSRRIITLYGVKFKVMLNYECAELLLINAFCVIIVAIYYGVYILQKFVDIVL